MGRLAKQLVFGGAYLALALLVAWGVFRTAVPAPVCDDGVRNGQEEGVDCGSVCGRLCASPVRPLVALPVQFIANSDGSWDALVRLENLNGRYGVTRVDYRLRVEDAAGAQLALRTEHTYVNPIQPRYLVYPLGRSDARPTSASLQFAPTDVTWSALTLDAAGAVDFTIRAEGLQPASASLRYSASVTNRSRFDFDTVDVTVLLFDRGGQVVGAGSTVIRTLRADEERAFVIDWPFGVPEATRAQVFVGTNVFDNANYIRAYGSQERFQGF